MASKNTDLTAERLMTNLQKDLGLTKEQAAGLVGNLAHESAGFKTLQEISPTVRGSRGGYGYAQWTGPRRRQFEAWTKEKGLDPTSYEANYGFLKHELQTNYNGVLRDLKVDDTLKEATRTILHDYESPAPENQMEGSRSVRERDRYANQFYDTITPTEYLGDLEQLDILSPFDTSYLDAEQQSAYPETITNDIADILALDDGLQYFDSMPRSKPLTQEDYSVMGALDQIDGFDTLQDMPVYSPAQEPAQGLAAIDDLFSMEGANSLPAAPLGRVDAFALDDLPSMSGGVDYGVSDTPMGQGSGSLPNLSLDDFGGPVAPDISIRGNNDFWAAEDRDQEVDMLDRERNDTLSSSLASLERAGLLDQLDSINAPPDISATGNIDFGSGPSASGSGAFSLRDPVDRIDDAFASVPAETWRETTLRQDATPQMYSRLADERVGNAFDVADAAAVPGDYSSSVSTHQLPDMLDTLPQSKPVAPIDLVGDVQPLYDDYQPVEPVSQPVADYTLPETLDTLPQSKPQPSTLAAQKAAKKMTGLVTTTLGGAVAGPLGALGGYALGKAIDGPVSNRVGDFVSGGYVGPSGMTYATDTGISRGLSKVGQSGNWGDFWDSNSQTDQTAQMAWDREKAASEGRELKSLLDAFTDDLSDAFSGKGKTVTGRQQTTAKDTTRRGGSADSGNSNSSGRSSGGGGFFSGLFGGDDEDDDSSSSSSGGTIICSELYRQGYMSKALWEADEKWGRMTARKDTDIIRGYRAWAAPVVRLMKRSPKATRIIAKLTAPWARQMAYEAGYLPKGNFLGWLTNLVGIPFSKLVGKGLKLHKKWRRKWA
ncbi:phage tail tip lysozyme [Cohaesibacter marisflavi]|uniref:phage tail tip lysozyme n=1 Tax=Cohaesibacter marisflavi TaxID=655353 RepID=UPI0029C888FA|nr:phage tail tip lysozyme [Cohaesibacter marisflavi]